MLYALTKLFIYAYLVEKVMPAPFSPIPIALRLANRHVTHPHAFVWLVWSPKMPGNMGQTAARWRSPLYRLCLMALSPFLVIIFLMIFGRIAEIRHDGVCVIGLKGYASLSLLIYDLLITLCLTLAFVWPLTRGDIISARLRNIASRTLVASIFALITSTINIAVLTSMHGKQLGWVCLASCGTDVTINALVIAWVSGRQEPRLHRCQHNCSGSGPIQGTPESLGGPQSPLPRVSAKWRGRPDDVHWDPFGGLEGPMKLPSHVEWSPTAKLEFDFGRRGSAAGLLAPGSNDSVLGPLQEPKSPPTAVPRSGLPFSLPKATEHANSESLGVDISGTAPGHAVFHLPLASPRFGRPKPLPQASSRVPEDAPSQMRSITLPDSTPGAGPSGRRKVRQRSKSKCGQETISTQVTSGAPSDRPSMPRRSTAEDIHAARRTLMRSLGSVLGLTSRASSASESHGAVSPKGRSKRRGLSRDGTTSVQEKVTQATTTTDISAIVFRHGDSQIDTTTTDSSDSEPEHEWADPSPRSRPVSVSPWEGTPRSQRIDPQPEPPAPLEEPPSVDVTEKSLASVMESEPSHDASSDDHPPPYRSRPNTGGTEGS
ncbi:hypothetical protein FRB90_009625 [Tulasnella sp. 427]|nr:hypothetical protein FRB90_009625 [Tulasnella sp. 427]